MTINLGTGPTLQEISPYLQNDAERHARFIDAAERNSVIEGLPPFSDELRLRLAQKMAAISAEPLPAPAQSASPAVRNSA